MQHDYIFNATLTIDVPEEWDDVEADTFTADTRATLSVIKDEVGTAWFIERAEFWPADDMPPEIRKRVTRGMLDAALERYVEASLGDIIDEAGIR